MDKAIGGFLQASAAFMFFAAGAFGGDAVLLLLPAALSGVAGVHLWSRSGKQRLPSAEQPARLETQLDQVRESLDALHTEVRQLRDNQEFFGQLYPGASEQPTGSRGSRPA